MRQLRFPFPRPRDEHPPLPAEERFNPFERCRLSLGRPPPPRRRRSPQLTLGESAALREMYELRGLDCPRPRRDELADAEQYDDQADGDDDAHTGPDLDAED